MTPFTTLTAPACALSIEGIDTDQLIPARFMSRARSDGYGDALLADLRTDPSFPLNTRPGTAILVTRRNFGAGSSREAAVYALWDYGIRCVLAPSFGDIFAANAVNNGLLPGILPEQDAERLIARLDHETHLTVNLETCQAGGLPFTLDPVHRTKLLNGWDDLDLTASYAAEIAAFVSSDHRPWATPASLGRGGQPIGDTGRGGRVAGRQHPPE